MSAKIARLLPALLLGCATAVLISACGGSEPDHSAVTSAASSQPQAGDQSSPGPSAPPDEHATTPSPKAQSEHDRRGGADTRATATRPSPTEPADKSNGGNVVERILESADPDRGSGARTSARKALDRLLAKAR